MTLLMIAALLVPGKPPLMASQSQRASPAAPVLSSVEGEAKGPTPTPDRARVAEALRSAPVTAPARQDATRADAQNVELVGQIGGLSCAVAVQGDYVYLGVGPRLVVLDVSNPANPTVVGRTEVLPDIVRGVAVAGNYAYVADGSSGLRIINVSDPAAPSEAGFYDTPGHANDVAVAAGDPQGHTYAYVADGDSGLRIINVTDPATPSEAGFYDTPWYARGVAVTESYAYVADWDSRQLWCGPAHHQRHRPGGPQ